MLSKTEEGMKEEGMDGLGPIVIDPESDDEVNFLEVKNQKKTKFSNNFLQKTEKKWIWINSPVSMVALPYPSTSKSYKSLRNSNPTTNRTMTMGGPLLMAKRSQRSRP